MSWYRIPREGTRKQNPETILTKQVREILRLLRIPHRKHWGGPMSPKGIPDIIGTLPGPSMGPDGNPMSRGRAFYCELKVRGGHIRPEQAEFIEEMREAGAVAFVAHSVRELLVGLEEAGFEPAKRIRVQLEGGTY